MAFICMVSSENEAKPNGYRYAEPLGFNASGSMGLET